MVSDTSLLFLQIGEILSSIRGFYSAFDSMRSQTEQSYELMQSSLVVARQSQRDLEQKLEQLFELVQHDIEDLRTSDADICRILQEVMASVDGVRQPVAEIMSLKARAGGILFAVGACGSAILWLAEPVYHWLVEAAFQRHW